MIASSHLPETVMPRLSHKAIIDGLDFKLPPELEASEPPEARGLTRDQVRLMVSYQSDNQVSHTQFRQIGDYLQAGDVLVINTSGTLNAALNAIRQHDGQPFELHLSTRLPADLWSVEVRQLCEDKTASQPYYEAQAGEVYCLPHGASATLLTPYNANERAEGSHTRLWVASISFPMPFVSYLANYGFPIRYSYVHQGWDTRYYQTVYANEMGSAEMPSAGRAFTPELLTQLVAMGVQIVPLILHTGVASLEDHEPPYEEYYRVPVATARIINMAKSDGKRVIAVGTTVIRALETVTDSDGVTHPAAGWTKLVILPESTLQSVNGLLTGMHEPRATHLAMLEALSNRRHLEIAYQAALQEKYLWHEFGDLHLILP